MCAVTARACIYGTHLTSTRTESSHLTTLCNLCSALVTAPVSSASIFSQFTTLSSSGSPLGLGCQLAGVSRVGAEESSNNVRPCRAVTLHDMPGCRILMQPCGLDTAVQQHSQRHCCSAQPLLRSSFYTLTQASAVPLACLQSGHDLLLSPGNVILDISH